METLADRIALNGKLEAKEAVTLAARLALRIEKVHTDGKVHGGISADAIVLPGSDLRRATLRPASSAPRVASYLSPERLRGKAPFADDDTWAIGVLLYTMLTGHSAFAGATEEKVAERIRSGGAAPLAVFDVADRELTAIVDAAIATDPEMRTSATEELREKLQLWLQKRGLATGAMLDMAPDEPGVKVDLTSVPPPPRLPGAPEPEWADPSALKDTLDEETTQPRPVPSRKPPSMRRVRTIMGEAPPPMPSTPPSSAPKEFGERLPPTSELLARAKKATTRPPPRLNPPKALASLSSRPPPLPPPVRPPSARPPPLPPPPASEPAPLPPARKSAPVIPLGPSKTETPSFEHAAAAAAKEPSAVQHERGPVSKEPAKRRGINPAVIAIGVLAIGGGGYAVYRFAGGSGPAPLPTSSPATSAGPEATSGPSSGATAPAAASAAPSAAASEPPATAIAATSSAHAPTEAPSTSAAPMAPPADVNACFVGLLAEGSIAEGAHPEFGFVCKDRDPRKPSEKVKSVVVAAAHGHVTDAMREWSMFGYWELAAYAAMRGRCCPGAEPLELPPSPGSCPALADELNAISAASHQGASESEQAEAAKGFHDALRCVVKSGQQAYLGDYPSIAGGQETAFLKTFARTRR